jgi:hypothetical protein
VGVTTTRERVEAALDELQQWVGNGPGRSDPKVVEGFERGIQLASAKIRAALTDADA